MDRTPRLPDDWSTIETIDAHAAGEPLRVVVDGFPALDGDTILERRRHAKREHDDVRTALVLEPRGHEDMYAAILTDPVTERGDVGVLFAHNDGYSTMCGHGIVALGVVLVETGMLAATPPSETIRFDTPAGLVTATASLERDDSDGEGDGDDDGDGERVRVESVSFENVPSFVVALDETVTVPGYGEVVVDVAYGGAFYAYTDASQFDLALDPGNASAIADAGMAVKRAVADAVDLAHPDDEDLGFLYGTIFRGPPAAASADSRNVCVFADGQVDRSPTGTGVSGRLAIQHARGQLDVDDEFVVESILGTTFDGRIVDTTTIGDPATEAGSGDEATDAHTARGDAHDAIVPRITGRAHLTGHSEFVRDPTDSLRDGFRID